MLWLFISFYIQLNTKRVISVKVLGCVKGSLDKKIKTIKREIFTVNLEITKVFPNIFTKTALEVMKLHPATTYLGLYPRQYQAGNYSSLGRFAKRGIPIAKYIFYMAAMGPVLYNPQLNKIFHDNASDGKSKKETLIILSKKIVTMMYSMSSTQQTL